MPNAHSGAALDPLTMLAGRAVLDTLLQSSIVELFRNYEIAVAPTQHCGGVPRSLTDYVVGEASLFAPSINGALALLVPSRVLACSNDEGTRPSSDLDWVRELTNQLVGRIRNRLAQYRTTLQVGLPTSTRGSSVRQEVLDNPFVVYGFRALRGEIVVVLTGTINCSSFVYSSVETVAQEGDVILF